MSNEDLEAIENEITHLNCEVTNLNNEKNRLSSEKSDLINKTEELQRIIKNTELKNIMQKHFALLLQEGGH